MMSHNSLVLRTRTVTVLDLMQDALINTWRQISRAYVNVGPKHIAWLQLGSACDFRNVL